MTRPLRVEYPGAYYHVINRGNAGENIFNSDRDREKFLEYLEKAVERFSIVIHTYCLMSNHYHLLIETPQPNLSAAIQWLNVSYAAYYNKKRQRSGHLFQGRFKSILVNADEYLTHLSRYIHLNPVRANMLAIFGKDKKEAVNNYRDFVEEIEIKTLENPEEDIIGGFILGDIDFVNWVKNTCLSTRHDEKEIPQLRKLKPKVSLETILQAVSDESGYSEKEIREKGRKGNRPRDIAIYLARDISGVACGGLGDYFGGVSGAAITVRYNKIAGKMAEDESLKRKIARIRGRIVNN
ncbi:MAG: transposase [Deltaproteobacteria bacterium]|nr:transposase [Deltaproteobacteria bacterium]